MNCPKCDAEQYCPCRNCLPDLPEGHKPWIWIDGEVAACSSCGYAAHADTWLDLEVEQAKLAGNWPT